MHINLLYYFIQKQMSENCERVKFEDTIPYDIYLKRERNPSLHVYHFSPGICLPMSRLFLCKIRLLQSGLTHAAI